MSGGSGHDYLKSHQVSGKVMRLDIAQEARAIMDAARASGQGHAGKTLVKDGPLRVLILGFTAGSSLREHDAGGPVSIQVVSGGVEVTASGRSEALQPGAALMLGARVSHSVSSAGDSVLLLTVAWPEA